MTGAGVRVPPLRSGEGFLVRTQRRRKGDRVCTMGSFVPHVTTPQEACSRYTGVASDFSRTSLTTLRIHTASAK
jgi:hypothetical protein